MKKKVIWLLNNVEVCIVVALIGIMMVLLFAQVMFRYVLNLPLAWTEEISMICLVWLCYFGASMAVAKRRHMKVTALTSMLPDGAQFWLTILANVAFIVFAAIIVNQNGVLTQRIFDGNQMMAATRLPKWIPYAGIPTAFGLIIIRLVQDIILMFKERKQGKSIQQDEAKEVEDVVNAYVEPTEETD